MSKPSLNCGPRSAPRSIGSMARAIPMATALSNICARPSRVSPIRAGRIRTTRSSMPTDDWPKAPSRSRKCRAMFTPPSAWRLAARAASGANPRPTSLMPKQTKLAEQFEAAFWCPEIETYALALDGAKRPCAVRTSNAGQVLLTGIANPARAALVAKGLLRPDFFSGWGIRTVARGEARYNPMSYHDGSIWPHDNALIALGFARYGLKRPIDKLFEGLFHAGTYMDHRRLPELFCGFRTPARSRAYTLSGRMHAAGVGRGDAVRASASLPRARIRSVRKRDPIEQSATARISRRGNAAQSATRHVLRGPARPAARRDRVARYAAHQRRHPGVHCP